MRCIVVDGKLYRISKNDDKCSKHSDEFRMHVHSYDYGMILDAFAYALHKQLDSGVAVALEMHATHTKMTHRCRHTCAIGFHNCKQDARFEIQLTGKSEINDQMHIR